MTSDQTLTIEGTVGTNTDSIVFEMIEFGFAGYSYDYIVQLQTRLRNHATKHHQMILSTNPDLGHVRSEFLLKADKIYGSDRNYHVPEEDKKP
jgi:hypothetical protein